MSFDGQGSSAGTKKRAGCPDSIQQTAGFLTNVVDPFAKVSVGGPFAVPFQPHVMRWAVLISDNIRMAAAVDWNINIDVTPFPSSCRCGSTMVPLQAREHPLDPILGRHVVVHVAIDSRMKARGAVALQSRIEVAAALAEVIIGGIAQRQDGKFHS